MASSLIFDLILVAILVISVIIGARKGFVRSIGGFITYLLSFAIANSFYSALSVWIKKIPFIAKMITDVEMPDLPAGATFIDKMKTVLGHVLKSGENVEETANAVMKNYIAELISAIIAFAVVFIVSVLLLKLLLLIADKIFEAPVLKQLNEVLGGVFGLLIGLFWTWILVNVFVKLALPLCIEKWPEVFSSEIENSVMVRICIKVNPVTYLLKAINWFSNLISGNTL